MDTQVTDSIFKVQTNLRSCPNAVRPILTIYCESWHFRCSSVWFSCLQAPPSTERNYEICNIKLMAVKVQVKEWQRLLKRSGQPFLVWQTRNNPLRQRWKGLPHGTKGTTLTTVSSAVFKTPNCWLMTQVLQWDPAVSSVASISGWFSMSNNCTVCPQNVFWINVHNSYPRSEMFSVLCWEPPSRLLLVTILKT